MASWYFSGPSFRYSVSAAAMHLFVCLQEAHHFRISGEYQGSQLHANAGRYAKASLVRKQLCFFLLCEI